MNQQKTTTQKLTLDELKEIKGGFRETPGIIRDSITVRWDEIIIRAQGRTRITNGLVANPGTTNANSGKTIMP